MSHSVNKTIADVAIKLGIPIKYLERLIWNESRGNINVGFDPSHYSVGIAQISKNVWKSYSKIPYSQAGDSARYKDNIMVGAHYLKANYNHFHDWKLAMAAYNAGPSAIDQVIAKKRKLPEITKRYISGL